jgi:ABC-type transport system substrate-binding protein
VFVKNANYWEGSARCKPRIGKVVARFIPEKTTQIATLLSGDLDLMWYVPPDQVDSLKAVPGHLTVSAGETMRVGYLANCARSIACAMARRTRTSLSGLSPERPAASK